VAHAFNSSLAGCCAKTYLMQFSEAAGFAHLHLHLVPRMADQPAERRGPRIFGYLSDDEDQWLTEAERDATALALRAAMLRPGVRPGGWSLTDR
jgi:hypothetical protein